MKAWLVLLLGGWFGAAGWSQTIQPTQAVNFDERERRIIAGLRWQAPPSDRTNRFSENRAAAHFGQYLFFDPRLSHDGSMACATCHLPAFGFADQRPLARGQVELRRHTQSLWQVAYQRWFFWDGRTDSLWSQALQPFEDVQEMAMTRVELLRVIASDAELEAAYRQLFGPLPDLDQEGRFPRAARPIPDQPDHPHHRAWEKIAPEDREQVNQAFANIGKAIAAYERLIVAGPAPFDHFAAALAQNQPHDPDVFTSAAQRGLKLFIGKANCRLCHNGTNFSDGEFHNNGVPPLKGGTPTDAGRWEGLPLLQADPFNSAGAYSDDPQGPKASALKALIRLPELWGQFRTPSLRNIRQSAPYMHQGQLATLADVVAFYADLDRSASAGHHREPLLQPLELNKQERADLVTFLESLSGDSLPSHLMKQPKTPSLSRP